MKKKIIFRVIGFFIIIFFIANLLAIKNDLLLSLIGTKLNGTNNINLGLNIYMPKTYGNINDRIDYEYKKENNIFIVKIKGINECSLICPGMNGSTSSYIKLNTIISKGDIYILKLYYKNIKNQYKITYNNDRLQIKPEWYNFLHLSDTIIKK